MNENVIIYLLLHVCLTMQAEAAYALMQLIQRSAKRMSQCRGHVGGALGGAVMAYMLEPDCDQSRMTACLQPSTAFTSGANNASSCIGPYCTNAAVKGSRFGLLSKELQRMQQTEHDSHGSLS